MGGAPAPLPLRTAAEHVRAWRLPLPDGGVGVVAITWAPLAEAFHEHGVALGACPQRAYRLARAMGDSPWQAIDRVVERPDLTRDSPVAIFGVTAVAVRDPRTGRVIVAMPDARST